MNRISLFDDLEAWRLAPANAFAGFVVSPHFLALSKRKTVKRDANGDPMPPAPIRTSSAKVYIAMFGKFLRWLASRGADLISLSSADLIEFLEQGREGEPELTSVIRFQYLGLLERVYAHLEIEPNPAREAMLALHRAGGRGRLGRNKAKAVLTPEQEMAFMRALPADHDDGSVSWKRLRDRAMQAVMLGAGLKVSEAIGLYLENVGDKDATGSLPISIPPASAGGTVRPHRTQLRPFAVPILFQWLQERGRLAISGPLLFPASLKGGRLNRATVYRQVKATFERTGLDPTHLGGRTLRNAFAVRELDATNSNVELVGEFLGHRKRRSIEPYAHAAKRVRKPAGVPDA